MLIVRLRTFYCMNYHRPIILVQKLVMATVWPAFNRYWCDLRRLGFQLPRDERPRTIRSDNSRTYQAEKSHIKQQSGCECR